MSRFDYLLDRVDAAEFASEPFRHLYIEDLFRAADLSEILHSPEIDVSGARSDEALFEKLFAAGYKIIDFPGCITDKAAYLRWHADKSLSTVTNTSCEGFGMTLRLVSPHSPVLTELKEFLASDVFNQALADKFLIPFERCTVDGGIQKYLDGYEISPHPDMRRKALTFMVNINPHPSSEKLAHHTHYLQFRDEFKYVQRLWEGNAKVERCWVPWSWCETCRVQNRNNSMVIFSPSNNTLHGVKARYEHLDGQRTQLYGNLWYEHVDLQRVEWENLNCIENARIADLSALGRSRTLRQKVLGITPDFAKHMARAVISRFSQGEVGKRNVN